MRRNKTARAAQRSVWSSVEQHADVHRATTNARVKKTTRVWYTVRRARTTRRAMRVARCARGVCAPALRAPARERGSVSAAPLRCIYERCAT
eukprot:4112966-Lingulodinium_polyedra.AAC.1